ncbi:arylesterase [Shewanella yunxiaonensis]|uniref:Arylesterase n=1 Tax=Shewanella yunxiaonensis TaxID=2829809 RepID=A0ABX7YWJ4_9GAMM|nr:MULTISPECIES: arylesterase [Shewanella]MDF0535126.1 arylesterase [Shewanella sp. A32]QUN07187.1 arylesterase [Shewanella yunxiaonensis]
MALLFKIASLCCRPAIYLLLVLLALPLHAATLLVLGDSLGASYGVDESKGWVEGLRKALPEHTIINGSVSGETTAGGLRRLPGLLQSSHPDVVLIELGGNDGLRGFSPRELKNNLSRIIDLSRQSDAEVLLSQVMVPPNYGPRYEKAFTAVYDELAKQESVTLIPFFMTKIAPHPELMQRDGIHPNEQAQPQITSFMLPWVKQALEKKR